MKAEFGKEFLKRNRRQRDELAAAGGNCVCGKRVLLLFNHCVANRAIDSKLQRRLKTSTGTARKRQESQKVRNCGFPIDSCLHLRANHDFFGKR